MQKKLHSAVSRDLLTPLSCIVIFVDLCLDRADVPPKEKMNILKQIKASARFVQFKMHDLLDLTLLENGKVKKRNDHFIVHNALNEIIQLVQFQNMNRRVTITDDYRRLIEHRIEGDKNRLQQVFMNLLTNAMKYSPDNSKISVTASSQAIHADDTVPVVMLSVIVQDEGPGIDLEDQDRIWLPLTYLEKHRRLNPHGVGLGLTLCKIICDNFGGDIAVFSDGATGSTFEFRFKVKYSYQGQDKEENPT